MAECYCCKYIKKSKKFGEYDKVETLQFVEYIDKLHPFNGVYLCHDCCKKLKIKDLDKEYDIKNENQLKLLLKTLYRNNE